MGTQYDALSDAHIKLIGKQHLFFCATAAPTGLVNVSPKGMDSLRVLSPNRILWRNFTGSGNETAGHLAQVNRMTLMWCGFESQTMIMRAYGTARTLHQRDTDWDAMNDLFPAQRGVRQIYDMSVNILQTSCGYAVPFYEFAGQRETLERWTEDRDDATLRTYHQERNTQTIDGLPTYVTGENA